MSWMEHVVFIRLNQIWKNTNAYFPNDVLLSQLTAAAVGR